MLRTGDSASSHRLMIHYSGQTVEVQWSVGDMAICQGVWQWEICRDGQAVQPVGAWEAVCWVSDQDVDYLELQIDLAGGMRIQRQMVLAREDRFLFLADAILGQWPGELQYRGVLPLARGVRLCKAKRRGKAFWRRETSGWRRCCRWACRNGAKCRGKGNWPPLCSPRPKAAAGGAERRPIATERVRPTNVCAAGSIWSRDE